MAFQGWIKNRSDLLESALGKKAGERRRVVIELIEETLTKITPAKILGSKIKLLSDMIYVDDHGFNLRRYNHIHVLSAGKAAYGMTEAFASVLRSRQIDGYVFSPSGRFSLESGLSDNNYRLASLGGRAGNLPVTDLIRSLGPISERDLVVVLLSGGASDLLSEPPIGLNAEEKRAIANLLLKKGASIHEVNTVRKHLSRIKGGQLVKHLAPASVITLALSDVVNNAHDVIGSGPTTPDPTTYWDAISVLLKYQAWNVIRRTARQMLLEGFLGTRPETPKPGDRLFRKSHYFLLADHSTLLTAASSTLKRKALKTFCLTHRLEGEAATLGKFLAQTVNIVRRRTSLKEPFSLLATGESVVTVKGAGKGGRNQELALSFAVNMANLDRITMFSFATDGVDGLTDAAGAIVDEHTIKAARKKGLEPRYYLARNDSHNFFSKVGDAIYTGPTGNNLGDLIGILVEG